MNAPDFSRTNIDHTVNELMSLCTELYGTRAPQALDDLFLREGGLQEMELIEFAMLVHQTFRVTFEGDDFVAFLDDAPNIAAMAVLLHEPDVKPWL